MSKERPDDTQRPTLVLLPGMDGTGELFAPLVRLLEDSMTIIVVRYPTDIPLTYTELTAIVASKLPAGPHVILGESFSGPIAVELAAARPPGLVGLILCCTFVRNPRPALAPLGGLLNLLSLRHLPMGWIGWLVAGRFSTPRLQRHLAPVIDQVTPQTLRTRLHDVLRVDATAALARVNVPTLSLVASHDRLVPPQAGQLIVATGRHVHEVVVEGPHFLLQSSTRPAAQLIQAFVHEVAGRATL